MPATLITVVIIGIVIALVLRYYPPLGRTETKERRAAYGRLEHYSGRKFVNVPPVDMRMDMKTVRSLLRDYAKPKPAIRPRQPLPVVPAADWPPLGPGESRVTWFGHSASLLELEGKRILIDPMLGKAPTPFPIFGNKRYSRELPVRPEELPFIDVVLLSHDHYDHLDYGTIRKLRGKAGLYIVPLGVGAHLRRWGIDPSIIRECDWRDEIRLDGIRFVCAPARHFSGRSLTDRDATLWCSWVIQGRERSVYYSGDGGYGPHFKAIGDEYGPFDLTLMECGQYDKRWADIHMLPEETVQAHLDVRGGVLLPVHWGAFTLSLHDWHDPIERVTRAAQAKQVKMATPRIGETVAIGGDRYPDEAWWK
ncbi:MBL fold metallo-hydrolase [Paenibacillus thailandensis]|uniref:MBL fold metallo-hydrolase n=1 Tax=Paenibacillus thailandensis TaxID=393250 RepID=A0ABW5QVD6_9BACL